MIVDGTINLAPILFIIRLMRGPFDLAQLYDTRVPPSLGVRRMVEFTLAPGINALYSVVYCSNGCQSIIVCTDIFLPWAQ